jgi:hypothetical protein
MAGTVTATSAAATSAAATGNTPLVESLTRMPDHHQPCGKFIRSGASKANQLPGPETATSVRFEPAGPPVVTDGPYLG